MQKTTSVSIGGRAFTCDQPAYDVIQKYLARCARKLGENPDKDEILSDIERSIADHLKESLKDEVVSEAIALNTIEAIGEVDTNEEDTAERADDPEQISVTDMLRKGWRRLRNVEPDKDHKIIFGTAAGIGREFNIDPFWVRLAFVLLSLGRGSGIFIYLVISFLIYNKGRTAQTASELIKGAERTIKSRPYEKFLRKFFKIVGYTIRFLTAAVALVCFMAATIGLTTLIFTLIDNPSRLSVIGAYHDWLHLVWILSVGLVVIIPAFVIFITAMRGRRVLKAAEVMAFVWIGIVVVAVASSFANVPRLKSWAIDNNVKTNFVYVYRLDNKVVDVCVSVTGNCANSNYYRWADNGVCQYGEYDNYRKDQYISPVNSYLTHWIPHSEVLKQPVTPESFCAEVVKVQERYPAEKYDVIFGNRPLSEQDIWTTTENGVEVSQPSYFFDYLVSTY